MKPPKLTYNDILYFMDFVTREANERHGERFSNNAMRSSLEQVYLGKVLADLAKRLLKFVVVHGKYAKTKTFKLTGPEQYALLIVEYDPDDMVERQSLVIDQLRNYCHEQFLAVNPVIS